MDQVSSSVSPSRTRPGYDRGQCVQPPMRRSAAEPFVLHERRRARRCPHQQVRPEPALVDGHAGNGRTEPVEGGGGQEAEGELVEMRDGALAGHFDIVPTGLPAPHPSWPAAQAKYASLGAGTGTGTGRPQWPRTAAWTCQLRPRRLRAVVQSVTIARCAAASVTCPSQTAVCSFVSTGSFLLLTPAPERWPGSAGSTHKLR